jgi:TRAP-type C4-dicarboxylate transport system permease small subunit
MSRVLLTRLILFLVPFAAWFAWSWVARRSGRPIGATPWTWLAAAGALLAAASLMATALLQSDNRAGTYVPAETSPDGSVTPGHFESRRP